MYMIDVRMNKTRVRSAGLGQLADVCQRALRQHVALTSTKERAVLAHAPSGETVFAACLRLFHSYPLAVRRHYAEHRYGSMVMMSGEAGAAGFFVLIMERDDLFAIRPWDRRDWARVEIRPREPVDDGVRRLIGSGVPVLRDGVLLGWVAGQQVRAVLAAHGRLPEPWDDASVVPGTLVMPRVGSQPAVLARYMQILSGEFIAGVGVHHQHPPLVPAGLHRGRPLRQGEGAPGQADRRDRALRDRGPGRGADHRTGRRPVSSTSRDSAARGRDRWRT